MTPASALQYTVLIRGWLKRAAIPHDKQVLADFSRSLLRKGAKQPVRQAHPATSRDIARACSITTDPLLRLMILVAWYSAARYADVATLTPGRIDFFPAYISLNWAGTKSDPFAEGCVTAIALSGEDRAYLERLCMAHGGDEQLFGFSRDQFARALQAANPLLTAHSVRRGALQELLDRGYSATEILLVSRHKSLSSLFHYLPQSRTEQVRTTADMSQTLAQGLSSKPCFPSFFFQDPGAARGDIRP